MFVGSKESTFTFRIQEEREIMGFSEDKTYKRYLISLRLHLDLTLISPDIKDLLAPFFRLCPDDRHRECTKQESEDPKVSLS